MATRLCIWPRWWARKVSSGENFANWIKITLHLLFLECICLLLNAQASVNVKNISGWSPLAEAISRGDRHIIELILRKLKEQTRESIKNRRPSLSLALNQIDDFYLELKWEFSSWVPLLSKILPNDICKIYKSGSKIRLDSTLIDFNEMHWQSNILIEICFN